MSWHPDNWVSIDLVRQQLSLRRGDDTIQRWTVSTALNGPGELVDSGCTPRGEHRVRILIGRDCPLNTVFVGRRPTGEIYTPDLAEKFPQRDWILTRVIWLTGCQSGTNRGGECDTLRRYIYIHGCPDSEPMGEPASHGCVRMRNQDVVELFDQLQPGCRVRVDDGDRV